MLTLDTDKEGYLVNLQDWNREVANLIAEHEGIELNEVHWQVLEALREFYATTDVSPAMRPFVKLVGERVGAQVGSSIGLMQLFGPSPAKTAAKIAGLPKPTHCL